MGELAGVVDIPMITEVLTTGIEDNLPVEKYENYNVACKESLVPDAPIYFVESLLLTLACSDCNPDSGGGLPAEALHAITNAIAIGLYFLDCNGNTHLNNHFSTDYAPYQLKGLSGAEWFLNSSNMVFAYRPGEDFSGERREKYAYMHKDYVTNLDFLYDSDGFFGIARSEFTYQDGDPNMWHAHWGSRMRPVALPGEWEAYGPGPNGDWRMAGAFNDTVPYLAGSALLFAAIDALDGENGTFGMGTKMGEIDLTGGTLNDLFRAEVAFESMIDTRMDGDCTMKRANGDNMKDELLFARLRRMLHHEDGSAMTEFIMFLPIWIVVFIGIENLGIIGMFATQVQLKAQVQLWNQAVTAPEGNDYLLPIQGGIDAADNYNSVADLPGNDQEANDRMESVLVGAGWGIFGHYGESSEKSTIPGIVFMLLSNRDDIDNIKMFGDAVPAFLLSDIIGDLDGARYPEAVLNDSIANTDLQSAGEIGAIIQAIVGASGLVHSQGAAIRYGIVFANIDETEDRLMGGVGSFSAGAHYDTLIGPTSKSRNNLVDSEFDTWGWNYGLFKADEQYDELLVFGEENLEGDGADNYDPEGDNRMKDQDDIDNAKEQGEEDIKEKCQQSHCSYPGPDGPDGEPDTGDERPRTSEEAKCEDEGHC